MYSLGLLNSLERNPTNLCLWGLSLVVCVLGAKWGKETKESYDCHADVYLIVQFPSWNMASVLIYRWYSTFPESMGNGSQHSDTNALVFGFTLNPHHSEVAGASSSRILHLN